MSEEKHEICCDTCQNENCQELSMIVRSNTIVCPRTVMVKPSNTNVAQSAMLGTQWFPYHARWAEFSWFESLLSHESQDVISCDDIGTCGKDDPCIREYRLGKKEYQHCQRCIVYNKSAKRPIVQWHQIQPIVSPHVCH